MGQERLQPHSPQVFLNLAAEIEKVVTRAAYEDAGHDPDVVL
jgi:hypothetical protein